MRLTSLLLNLIELLENRTKFCIRDEIASALEIEDVNQLLTNKTRLALWLLETIIRCIRNSI